MVAAAAVVVLVVARLLRRAVSQQIADSRNRYRVRKLISFIGYTIVALIVVTVYSDRLGGLTVAFGVAGAGIAFALQEVVASVAGWLAISFGDFYKPGDRVSLGGITGDVIDIGTLRTTLMELGQWVDGDLYNGRIVRVANSFVFKDPVFNYSADFPFLWDEIRVPVRLDADLALARALIERASNDVVGEYTRGAVERWSHMVKKYLIEDARLEPMVTLVADENWATFTVRYVVDCKRRRVTKDQLFTRVLALFDEHKAQVALACAGFEVVSAPRLTVDLQRSSVA